MSQNRRLGYREWQNLEKIIQFTMVTECLCWIFNTFYLCALSFCLFFSFLSFSRAAPTAYGGSQARNLIGATAAGLRQSHSNTGSEPCLQPTSQLMAMPDP